jgi:hypothetical protein
MSLIWISMLFSAMNLGYQICIASGEEVLPQHREKSDAFLNVAARALVAGQYHKARPYSVEATMLYASCKFFGNQDADSDAWMLMGVAARLALKMGYHRDPRHFSHISPFEGELRRRTFCIVQTFELLLSFQAGLPAIIHEEACDIEFPGNLYDEDFDEDSSSIPPSRPPTDATPMLYYCYKGRLAATFRKVARLALYPKLPPYADVMDLDAELRRTRSEIPPSLASRPIRSGIADDSFAVMHRLNLELTYLKSMMILHRRYLTHERSSPKYAHSREACVTTSFQVLQHQAELYQASQPGAQLYNQRWPTSSIATHDFLLAGTILCLDLYESCRESLNEPVSFSTQEALAKQYDALKTSQEIWQTRRTISADAKRAASILGVMLSKINRPGSPGEATVQSSHGLGSEVSKSLAEMTVDTSNAESFQHPSGNGQDSVADVFFESTGLEPPAASAFAAQDFLDTAFPASDLVDWVGHVSKAGVEC